MSTTGQAPNPAALSGNEAVVKIDGKIAGFGKQLSVNIQNHVEPIVSLGFRKPRGLKSLNWSGTASMDFTVLTEVNDGVVPINTSSDDPADYNKLYTIVVIHKTTGKEIGTLEGVVNNESFELSNNQFSDRKIEFELRSWTPGAAFN
jgi:hypothetical protein